MAYELFQNKAAKFGSPQVTIRSGKIAFNADAGDLWDKVGAARYTHLLWDAQVLNIAIRPAKKQDGNAFLVSSPEGKRGKTVSAQSFLRYIHWTGDEAVVLDATWNEAAGLLEITVPKERIAPPTTPTRRKGTVSLL